MRRAARLVPLALLPATLAATLAAQAPTAATAPFAARVDSLFAFATATTPGCAVAAVQDGAVRYARGYGVADLEHDVPIAPSTAFYLASVSKQFTAAAVHLLVLDGKLSLDDDVRTYVPELPAYGRPITIRHLVHHTSGLRDYLTLFALRGLTDHPITNAEFLETTAGQKALNFPTGEQYSYSNTGYVLLSIVVERVTGQSLRAFAQERIFAPLGMTSTQFRDRHATLIRGRALAYRRAAGGGYEHAVPYFDVVGDGGLYSTVEDLARWEANFLSPRVGGAAWLTLTGARGSLADGTALAYGAGLVHGTYRGDPVVEHGGSLGGYNIGLTRFPARRFAVAVLCNDNTRPAGALARLVADVFLGDVLAPPTASATPGAPDARDVVAAARASAASDARYAGTYFDERNARVVAVVAQDGALVYQRAPGDRPALRPLGAGRFAVAGSATTFAFSTGADTLRAETPGAPPAALRRVTRTAPRDARARAAAYAAYAAAYASEELGVRWTVVARDTALVLRLAQGDSVRLVPQFDDAFRGGALLLRFTRDGGGAVTGLLASSGDRVRNVAFARR